MSCCSSSLSSVSLWNMWAVAFCSARMSSGTPPLFRCEDRFQHRPPSFPCVFARSSSPRIPPALSSSCLVPCPSRFGVSPHGTPRLCWASTPPSFSYERDGKPSLSFRFDPVPLGGDDRQHRFIRSVHSRTGSPRGGTDEVVGCSQHTCTDSLLHGHTGRTRGPHPQAPHIPSQRRTQGMGGVRSTQRSRLEISIGGPEDIDRDLRTGIDGSFEAHPGARPWSKASRWWKHVHHTSAKMATRAFAAAALARRAASQTAAQEAAAATRGFRAGKPVLGGADVRSRNPSWPAQTCYAPSKRTRKWTKRSNPVSRIEGCADKENVLSSLSRPWRCRAHTTSTQNVCMSWRRCVRFPSNCTSDERVLASKLDACPARGNGLRGWIVLTNVCPGVVAVLSRRR